MNHRREMLADLCPEHRQMVFRSGHVLGWAMTIALLLAMQLNLQGATYYVATHGNNSNPGSQGAPWLTIQKAANTMVAGDTVNISEGDYTAAFYTSKNGTQLAPITYQGIGLPKIVGAINLDHSHNIFQGLVITNIIIGVTATNVILQSNVISRVVMLHYDFGNRPVGAVINSNVFLNPARNCATFQGTGHLISSNHWEKTSALVPETDADGDMWVIACSNSRFVGNYVTNWANPAPGNPSVHTDLIQSFSNNGEIATNNVIERNTFLNCTPQVQFGNITDDGSAGRISNWTWRNNIWANIGAQMSLTAPDFKFYNNTFYRVGTESGGFCLFRTNSPSQGAAHNCQVFNNIFVNCGTAANPNHGWWGFVGAPTNFQSGGNLVVGNGVGTTKIGFTNGINGSDPLFVAPSVFNFRLGTGSPAIGAGRNLNNYFTGDFDGMTRGTLWDIGTFKFQSGPTGPIIVISPPILDFGRTGVSTNKVASFTVQNVGDSTLSGGAVTSPPFSIISGATYALAVGESQTIFVRYSPSSFVTNNQEVTFTGGGGFSASVKGYGIPDPARNLIRVLDAP